MSTILDAAHGPADPVGTRLGRRRRGGAGTHLRLVRQPVTARCDGERRHSRQGAPAGQLESLAPVSEALAVAPLWPVRPERVRRPRVSLPESAAPARLRITRRGRLLLTVLVALLALSALSHVAGGVAAAGLASLSAAPSVADPGRVVTVLPGQTLWQIAVQVEPERDPRDVVIELRDANGMPDSRVYAGQELMVPGE